MANDIPVTTVYMRELLNKIQNYSGALADTFNQDGVKLLAGKAGDRIAMEEFTNSDADALTSAGTLTTTDFASTARTLTLTGKQKAFAITDQEMNNTYHDIMTGAKMGAGLSIYEAVEYLIRDFLNLNVRQVSGSVAAINSLDDLAGSLALLSTHKAPQAERYAALGSTNYQTLATTTTLVGANVQGNASVISSGILGQQSGLQLRDAVYASQQLTNGTFGSGITVKTTAAAGSTSLVVTGVTASQTGAFIAGTVIQVTTSSVTYNYVVQAAADSDSSGDSTLTLSPATEVQHSASDTVTVLTGTSGNSYRKNYVYQREFAQIASRLVAQGLGYSAEKTRWGWILTTKVDKNTQSWGSNNLGAATLFGIQKQFDDYAVVQLSN